MITPSEQIPHEWARVHFAGAELSRVKQVDRVITIAEAMAQSPGATLPQMFAHPYDLKAAYQFFADPEATPDHLPGWITLWRGWQYLQTLVEGALIARNLKLKPD